jgi:uncharacterized protein YdeI (YjbR/CyaY-like superfamily)
MSKTISDGTVHKMPADLKKALLTKQEYTTAWENITPLARNEFICWVENAKLIDTRKRRISRTCQELLEGKRRPCCWVGCVHRPDKEMSPSQKWVLGRKKS